MPTHIYNWSAPLALLQGCSRRSGRSSSGRTSIFLKVKTKLRKQVINKSTRVIFGLVQLVILWYSRYNKDIMRWKIIGRPRTQNISCSTGYFIVQKLSDKQSAKVWWTWNITQQETEDLRFKIGYWAIGSAGLPMGETPNSTITHTVNFKIYC